MRLDEVICEPPTHPTLPITLKSDAHGVFLGFKTKGVWVRLNVGMVLTVIENRSHLDTLLYTVYNK